MAWRRNQTCPLALFLGHKVVAVAMTTTKPEVHALGGDGVVVVAGYPSAAGASSTRQRAKRALNWREEKALYRNASPLGQKLLPAQSRASSQDNASSLTVIGWVGAALAIGS